MGGQELLIDDGTSPDLLFAEPYGRGLVPRDWDQFPEAMYAPPSDLPLIPEGEWSDRIKEKVREKAQLSDVYLASGMAHLDQGRSNYCWAHSTVHCVMIGRAAGNQPHVPLSAFAVAAVLMKGRNEGGWCGLSQQFLREVGVPSQSFWPQGNFSLSLDTPQMRANAALHKVTEEWADLTRRVYDQNLTFQQLATCLLSNVPCAVDFSWWGHSVCALDLVEVEPGDFGIRILNSWANWGDRGLAVLRGGKARPDGAVAMRATGGSAT